jgi:hypothetical protein
LSGPPAVSYRENESTLAPFTAARPW